MHYGVTAMLSLLLALPTIGAAPTTTTMPLDGNGWLLAPDPTNIGVAEKWCDKPQAGAKPTKVPWAIQATFPDYSGYAWYWRDVVVPANPHKGGRYLLRFWDVDYVSDVWVNGKHIGTHEGAQARFTLDATSAVKPGETNRIAVRVLSLGGETIDGFARGQTPHGGFVGFHLGGILDSAELIIAPQIRMDDLFVCADPKTGKVRIEATVYNESRKAVRGNMQFSVAPATSGEPVGVVNLDEEIKPGKSTIKTEMQIANPRPWQLNDPYLYRMTARLNAARSSSVDETSTRFGFRDFRFENGNFRLNGKRIFWRSAHTGADTPGNIMLPHDPDILRRDLLSLKSMGFTGVRFISRMGLRYQLDMADEIGLMVYEESYASWMLQDSPQVGERMDRSFSGMLLRDRNHPSVVMWGLLNETRDGNIFRHAVASLPLLRSLDDSRIVVLGSGRFDTSGNHINGLEVWKPETGFAPTLTHNPKPQGICACTLWRPGEVAMTPGVGKEYSAARWTAPADGDYTITARFRGSGPFSMTNVHVLQAGKPVFSSFINQNGRSDDCTHAGVLHMSRGQALDCVVGGQTPGGGEWYERWEHNTTLVLTITSVGDGRTYDLAGDFSNSKNPNGTWSYGWMAAAATPDSTTFTPFAKCEPEHYDYSGDICNPGSDHWEDIMADQHYYPRVPHRELEIARLRTIAGNGNPLFLSEYGVGSAADAPRLLRQFEQNGMDSSSQASEIKTLMGAFMPDWQRLKLDDTFASIEDFFSKCVAREASLKKIGINAIRSNPNIIGYSMTGLNDPLTCGEGIITLFREPKPGVSDAVYDGFYPTRWCTFAEPVSIYRGRNVHLEAVLANDDTAPPGQYPARLQIIGPDNLKVMDRTITVTIPDPKAGKEPAFAIPVWSEDVSIDGPTGKYRFLVTFQQGIAASGGEAQFYVTDSVDMPSVDSDIAMWGDDPELTDWLKANGVKVRPYVPGQSSRRQVILVSYAPNAGGTPEAWRDLATQIAQGSTAIFLTHEVFVKGDAGLYWLPVPNKGTMDRVSEYWWPQLYPKDEWAKKHPLFEGLPCGGLMDYTFYREIIPDWRYVGQSTPDEAVAGAFRTSMAANPGAYRCDMMLSVYNLGAGRVILNSLRVRQALGQDPTAEWLLRNMLRYAAKDLQQPVTQPEGGIDGLLKAIGYN